MKGPKKITRRRHAPDLKAKILSECHQPGASVASVAMSHGINANVVHKWRRLANAGAAPLANAAFVPIALPAPVATVVQDIRVELRRGATAMTITWPMASATGSMPELEVLQGRSGLRSPPHEEVNRRDHKHRKKRRGDHAADHGRSYASHDFGARSRTPHDRKQARQDDRHGHAWRGAPATPRFRKLPPTNQRCWYFLV